MIAATSRNLKLMVSEGSFRPDLYDRLNILQLETIPLRCQKGTIRDLFLRRMDEERPSVGRDLPFVIDENALCEVEQLQWKGNYRELRNFATRLAVESIDVPVINADLIRNTLRPNSSPGSAGAALSLLETISDDAACSEDYAHRNFVTVMLDPEGDDLDSVYVKAAGAFIEYALKQTNGNLRRAARSMGTTHSTLSRILKKHKERTANSFQVPPHESAAFSAAA